MDDEIYSHPLIKPLLNAGPAVPEAAIEELAEAIRGNKTLARRCNNLFRIEASFHESLSSYLVIWLAFGMALARDEKAILCFVDLFELVDPIEHDMLWELAQYVLWQYGDKAVREVLDDFDRILDIDYNGYYLGVLEVIGRSSDQLLRKRVADKVIESLLSENTTSAALMGLVDLALILEDSRLSDLIDDWKERLSGKDRQVLEQAEEVLFDKDNLPQNQELDLSWTELAEFSAEHFTVHMEAKPHLPIRGPESESIVDRFKSTTEAFMRSSRFLEVPARWSKEPDEVSALLVNTLIYLYEAFGSMPEEADAEEVSVLITEVLPRTMVGEVSAFEPIPSVLAAFYRFITDSYSAQEGDEFADAIFS